MSEPRALTRSELTQAWLSNPDNWADAFAHIAADRSGMRGYCYEAGIIYETVRARMYGDPELRSRYDAAREEAVDAIFDRVQDVENKLLDGSIDAKSGAALIKSLNWRIEKLDPRRYGPRQQIDMRTTDMTKIHGTAIKELARRPRPSIAHQPGNPLPITYTSDTQASPEISLIPSQLPIPTNAVEQVMS